MWVGWVCPMGSVHGLCITFSVSHKWNDDVWNSILKQWSSSPIFVLFFNFGIMKLNLLKFLQVSSASLCPWKLPWLWVLVGIYSFDTFMWSQCWGENCSSKQFHGLWFFIFIMKCVVVLWCLDVFSVFMFRGEHIL